MKIWRAQLFLNLNENYEWETQFIFRLEPKEYELNKQFNEWTRREGWILYGIPMDMVVEKAYEGYVVGQGFDYELDSKELKELENKMRELLIQRLHNDKEQYLITLSNKLRAIKE